MRPTPDLTPDSNWRRRFRARSIAASQIARRNPQRGLIIANRNNGYQLFSWDVPSGGLKAITTSDDGVQFGGISPDGTGVYYMRPQTPLGKGGVVRAPIDGGEPVLLTEGMSPFNLMSMSAALDAPLFGFASVDHQGFGLWVIRFHRDGTPQAPDLIHRAKQPNLGPFLSADGRYGVAASLGRGDMGLLVFDLVAVGDEQTVRGLQEESGGITPVAFAPIAGDTRFLANTDVTGFKRPVIWDVASGDRIDLPFNGIDGDIVAWDWSPDARRLLIMQFVSAHYTYYEYDLDHSTLDPLDVPNGTAVAGYYANDDDIFMDMEDSTRPLRVVGASGGTTRDVLALYNDLPPSIRWQSVTISNAGTQGLHGWLATPDEPGPYPAIIHAHGGPTDVQTETFMPLAQMWLDHGFAFLSVNYRGSTSFGRQFEHSILGQPGTQEAADLASARNYLVQQGIAKRGQVFAYGASYGGSLALLAVSQHRDDWGGAITLDPILNWEDAYEMQSFERQEYLRALFGGDPDSKLKVYRAASPMTHVKKLSAPALLVYDQYTPPIADRYADKASVSVQVEGTQNWNAEPDDQGMAHAEIMLRWVYSLLTDNRTGEGT